MKNKFLQVEPSIIGGDLGRISEEAVACVEAGATMLHLDVMDGLFVKNFTIGPAIVKAIRKVVPKDIFLDCHLMIYKPDDYIERFIEAGADGLTFHSEATEDVEFTLDFIKKCGKRAGLAIKPESTVDLLMHYIDQADLFLIMTVDPGFGGQTFMADMMSKVKFLREEMERMGMKKHIQVDGGIDHKTGATAVENGANLLVSGSFLFKQDDRKAAIEKFQALEKLREFK